MPQVGQKMHDAIRAVIAVHGANPEICANALEALLAGNLPPWQDASTEEVATTIMDAPMINIGSPRHYGPGESKDNNPARAHIEACKYMIADTLRRGFLILAQPTPSGPRLTADVDDIVRMIRASGTLSDGTRLTGLALFLLRTYSMVPRG